MVRACGNEFALFRNVIDLLQEAAVYLIIDEGATAQRARQRLEAKDDTELYGAFFATIHSDSDTLRAILPNIEEESTWNSEGVLSAVRGLLHVVQEQFVNRSGESSSDDESDEPEAPFMSLQRLTDQYNKLALGATTVEKASWLVIELNITKTKSKQRRPLLSAMKTCLVEIQALVKPQKSAKELFLDQVQTSERLLETPLFANVEEFHQTLAKTWICECYTDRMHQDAVFSFYAPPASDNCYAMGTMYFRTQDDEADGWKHTSFEYQKQRDSYQTSLASKGHARGARGDMPPSELFCSALHRVATGDLIRVASGSNAWHLEATEQLRQASALKNSPLPSLPLSPCFELAPNHPVYTLSKKKRLMLALYLAYAYLHLSGGCWWPYTNRSSVMLPNDFDVNKPPPAFFSAAFLQRDDKHTPEIRLNYVEQLINHDMPSLVAFGRLLLELWVGHQVIWDNVPAALHSCEDDLLGRPWTWAINACLQKPSSNSDKISTIREDQRARNAFIREVLLPLQYVVCTGFHVAAEDVFPAPPVARPRKVRRIILRPPPMRPAEPQSTAIEYCLHDGDNEYERVEDSSGRDADAHMDQLQKCFSTMLDKIDELCPEVDERYSARPVNVAILDTGVQMTKDYYKRAYQNRLKECRTWIGTSTAAGESLPLGTHDVDGHGTHVTSVLLQATRSTDVHVYVAQVFAGRKEQLVQGENEKTSAVDRIVNAIEHAVNVWKVDVISMSFGFPKPIPAINAALARAEQNNVVLLAAASNCGANAKASWPARDAKVLSIYAATGIGNKYQRNPTARLRADNFATLGTAVKALWPHEHGVIRKSGTSTATPVCAAIVAVIISVLRRSEDKYIAAYRHMDQSDQSIDERRDDYRAKLNVLGKASNMASVLRLMVEGENTRDGYDYLTPWTVFNKNRTAMSIIESLLEAIDA